MASLMQRICSWCKKPLGEKPGGNGPTHGICEACKKRMEEQI